MPVSFTVDAYPNETFRGTVVQIRLNAPMTQNVVTYTVVVETDNSDLRLLPYLTANLKFEIEQYHDVLMVPNAALRWKPRLARVARRSCANSTGRSRREKSEGRRKACMAQKRSPLEHPPRRPGSRRSPQSPRPPAESRAAAEARYGIGETPPKGPKAAAGSPGKVRAPARRARPRQAAQVEGPRRPRPAVGQRRRLRPWINVRIGATDGMMTVVRGKEVSDGMEVVIGEVIADRRRRRQQPLRSKLLQEGRQEGS